MIINLENLTKTEYIQLEADSRTIKEACIEIFMSNGNLMVAYRLYKTDALANPMTTFEQFKQGILLMAAKRN